MNGTKEEADFEAREEAPNHATDVCVFKKGEETELNGKTKRRILLDHDQFVLGTAGKKAQYLLVYNNGLGLGKYKATAGAKS